MGREKLRRRERMKWRMLRKKEYGTKREGEEDGKRECEKRDGKG